MPLLNDPASPWDNRYLFTHVGRWGKGKAADSKYLHCRVRDNRYSLICDTNDGSKKWQLFDLNADYGEKENIAAANPEVVARLEAAYDQWWNAILPCLENENAVGPAVNPFKKLYWEQFGGGPAAGKAKAAKE